MFGFRPRRNGPSRGVALEESMGEKTESAGRISPLHQRIAPTSRQRILAAYATRLVVTAALYSELIDGLRRSSANRSESASVIAGVVDGSELIARALLLLDDPSVTQTSHG